MDHKKLLPLLEGLQRGEVSIEQALEKLRALPYEQVGDFARLDNHRALRTGFPEVVFGAGKSIEQVRQIVLRLVERQEKVLVTRASPEMFAAVQVDLPDARYHDLARAIVVNRSRDSQAIPGVLVVTGGTADIPVAEEAALTAELMDCEVQRLYDVGVAGLHRLLDHHRALQKARVIVVAAGMEGALPSVIGGLVAAPVIAVPTSVGYGASFNGLAALLSMLNSCATGVAVVNIDNGFGAGYMAATINQMADKTPLAGNSAGSKEMDGHAQSN